jgi:hypothetical protein
MVPILNLAWSGYLVAIMRNVMNGNPEPLPTWDDLDRKFREGLILFVAGLIYASPVLIALGLPLGISILSSLSSGNNDMQDLGRRMTEIGWALVFGLLCVFLLYGLVLSILYPAILILFSREGTFAACFKLRDVFRMIRSHPRTFFTAWGLSIGTSLGVGLLAGFVNMVVGFIPCIGWIVSLILSLGSGVYITAVHSHLFGQFGRAAFTGNQFAPATPADDPSVGSGQAPD